MVVETGFLCYDELFDSPLSPENSMGPSALLVPIFCVVWIVWRMPKNASLQDWSIPVGLAGMIVGLLSVESDLEYLEVAVAVLCFWAIVAVIQSLINRRSVK